MLLNVVCILLLFRVNTSQYHTADVVPFSLFCPVTKFLCLETACRIMVKCYCELKTTEQAKPCEVRGKSSKLVTQF